MSTSTDRVLLGHITGVSGLKGWVKVHSDTSPRENIVRFKLWWLKESGQWRQIRVEGGRPQGKTIVAGLEGIDTPEKASSLIGATIAVERSQLPSLSKDEFYWADLVGMQVLSVDKVRIGPVIRLFETGANDVMVVKDMREQSDEAAGNGTNAEGSQKEILVPWLVPSVITDVDVSSREITIDWDPDF